MEAVTQVLNNPIIRTGLKVVAPEIAVAVEVAMLFLKKRKKRASIEKLLEAIDKRLAKTLETLATTESKGLRRECEIRAHELLGVLNEWDNGR